MSKQVKVTWQETKDANERLEELRKRDLEISRIAVGLQMRTAITKLENENAALRAMESTWTMSRLSRLYFTFPSLIGKFINRLRKIV